MKKITLVFLASIFLFSCGDNSPKNKETVDNTETVTSAIDKTSKIGRENYAVVWEWTTTNADFVQDNLLTISKELTALWKDDVVENVYYNNMTASEKLDYIANVSFFMKAHSKEKAEAILNELTVVKKGIAKYNIHPVGLLWLDRKTDKIYEKGVTKTFITVWENNKEAKPTDELVMSQSDEVLKLWKSGAIENVYFDIKAAQESNKIQDFVFFVNANTIEEAKAACNSLPFSKENIATYKIYPVGVFWMGIYENN